ncbi:hypothetical protein C8Q80DRAFT_1354376 [Daedaleopsis nitida]|nr:hypothetical protein C8Q80DRAFT_1354376 [Daedaleopsis nitida]
MRSSTFLGLLVLLVSTTRALPLPSDATFSSTSATTVTTPLSTIALSSEASSATGSSVIASSPSSIASSDSILPTASASSSANDSSVVTSATDSSTATATIDPSPTDSSAISTSTDNTSIADPSTTVDPTPSDVDEPTSTFVDPASSTTPTSSSSAAPTNTGISFDIPEVPPACLALASGIVSTPSTPTSTSSLPSATDGESSAAAVSDAPVTPSSTTSTDISSSVASANATTSSDSSVAIVSTSTVDVTGSQTATASASLSPPIPTGAPVNATLSRRIAQADLPDVAQSWQDLCLASGGDIFTDEPCVQLAGIGGINALLADADPCAQQDNADAMVDFAKSPGVTNVAALIANALAYRRHPRNAFSVNGVLPATPYCTRAPRNAELLGVANAQLDGVDPGVFGSVSVGLIAFGADGTCPFGQTPDVSTCGCS